VEVFLERLAVGVDSEGPVLAVRNVETVSVVLVVEVETLEIGLEEYVPVFVLVVAEVEAFESRDTGRETGRARGPLPVTLTFNLEERVLPLEFGLR
jgi:hypothetical protein